MNHSYVKDMTLFNIIYCRLGHAIACYSKGQ